MNSDIAQLASLAHSQIPLEQAPEYQDEGPSGSKRKVNDGQQQGPSKSRRSRYISLACNECKRRKIKCNGQTPCQRCGNLNLECVYAANCCNAFKEAQEYKDLVAHVAGLQDQVNALYDHVNTLRAQLGQSAVMPPAPMQQTQYPQSSSIDPSLQTQGYSNHTGTYQTDGQQQQQQSRPKSQSQSRGPPGTDFSFAADRSSLPAAAGIDEDTAALAGASTTYESSRDAQLHNVMHIDKDPLWSIPRREALRLCQIFEEETGTMYPVVDIGKMTAYVGKLYPLLEAMHRTGLMQAGMPGADAFDDEDTNILKLILATALTIEGGGSSELGTRLFERVHPAIDNLLLGNVSIKGIRLLLLTAVYESQRNNEGATWRLVGLAARMSIEIGLNRRLSYEVMMDQTERLEATLLFWTCYVLDTRWTSGTSNSSAMQDVDIDPTLPQPDHSPYLTAMIKYIELGGKVSRSEFTTGLIDDKDASSIAVEEMNYLDYEVLQWHRSLPALLQFHHPDQQERTSSLDMPPARTELRTQVVLYLRANVMRMVIHRRIRWSSATVKTYRKHAEKVLDIAKDTIRVLTLINQTTDLFRKQDSAMHASLTTALAFLFLAVSFEPATYARLVREEFLMATDLIRDVRPGSFASRKLWRALTVIKEAAPRLEMSSKALQALDMGSQPSANNQRRSSKEEIDPNRSAAVAMAGLAGHNVDEMAVFNQENQGYRSDDDLSGQPDATANELAHMFEIAGQYGAEFEQNSLPADGEAQSADTLGDMIGNDELSNFMKELF